ncbi:hypothetical protein [Paractinoplanes lichenicola]|uniref:Uncharacterized protein n=1 Tax=Paractinoplanes lichenicola TaxID=2802976 RepID=A0ABS1VLN5_9ACTN|nr:hypothetical protein [Actinoplanes lichenicola]MBL7255653.1 hypothetical protein [Actinoplanes lichenicola]
MESSSWVEVAGVVTWFGVLGMIVTALAVVAVRLVRAQDVPAYVQGRARWWAAHNVGFLVASLVVTVGGICALMAANLAA